MSEANKETSRDIYRAVCAALDRMEVGYCKYEDVLAVEFDYRGQDMNHNVQINIEPGHEVIRIVENLPFKMYENKSEEIADAVCYANRNLVSGRFIYNMSDEICFKISQFYSGNLINYEVIKNMIIDLVIAVESYDDKFMALNKGYLKPEDFAD